MPEIIATRPMTVLGEDYSAGDRLPAEELGARKIKQLIDQRRAEESRIKVKSPNKRGGS